MIGADVGFIVAFIAGFLAFVSPCVLPLFPSYLTFITGISFDELAGAGEKRRAEIVYATLINSVSFVAGFSLVFTLMGLGASAVGRLLIEYRDYLRIIGGIAIIFFGLALIGVLRSSFLMMERRAHLRRKPLGAIGSALAGVAFAAGWTPCIGPILGSILIVASTSGEATRGMALLLAFSLGLGLPFIFSALAFNVFLGGFKSLMRHVRVISIASGVLMIIIGLLLVTDTYGYLNAFVNRSSLVQTLNSWLSESMPSY